MVKVRRIFVMVLALAFIIGFCRTGAVAVDAGTSGVYIEDGSVFEGDELSVSEWYFSKSAGIALEKQDGASVIAVKTKDVGKLFTSRTKVIVSKEIENSLAISMRLSITKLLDEKKFGFAFGSPTLLGDINAAGTTFLWFENSGSDYKYGLIRFGDGTETTLAAERSLTAETAANLAIDINVSGSGKMTLELNGETIYSSVQENEVSAEGFISFVQDGIKSLSSSEKTEIYIKDLNILNQYYDRPETPLTVRANFAGNEFNTEEWHMLSRAAAPGGGIFVDNEALKFNGSGQGGFFGTNFKYSNFVLEYDLFDVKNTPTVESDGRINSASMWQGVVFGIEGDISATMGRDDNRDCLVYFSGDINAETGERSSNVTKLGFLEKGKYRTTSVILPDKYSMFTEGFTDKVRVRLAVSDGKMTVSLKLTDEYDFTEIYSYEFENGYTPSGYVSLHGEGNQFIAGRTMYCASYFTLDNIRIVNYDLKPNVVKVGFTSNVLKPYADYSYVNTWSDQYLVVFTEGKGTK